MGSNVELCHLIQKEMYKKYMVAHPCAIDLGSSPDSRKYLWEST